MAVTYPFDLLDTFPGWSTEFDLLYRQEQSRTAGGVTTVKDLGSPLWQATYQSRSLRPNELDVWRARLKGLEGGLKQFWGRPLSRCYPIQYQNGTGMGNVTAVKIASIGADRKTVTLSGLPAGYKASVGDYIQIGVRNLHQLVDTTGGFEIRPHLWPETAVNDAAALVRPSCRMIIVPGSINTTADPQTGRGSVTFQAVESR